MSTSPFSSTLGYSDIFVFSKRLSRFLSHETHQEFLIKLESLFGRDIDRDRAEITLSLTRVSTKLKEFQEVLLWLLKSL